MGEEEYEEIRLQDKECSYFTTLFLLVSSQWLVFFFFLVNTFSMACCLIKILLFSQKT